MKKAKLFLALIALAFTPLAAWSFSGTCNAFLDCPYGPDISCSISISSPYNSVNCWVGPGSTITCCEFDIYGNPIRDIHKTCTSSPCGGGCGGGGGGGGQIPA